MDVYDLIMHYWKGRPGVYGECPPGSHFRPVNGDLTAEDLRQAGDTSYGFYLMNLDETTATACIDIDNHGGKNPLWRDHLVTVLSRFTKYEPVIELSQSGEGAHLWVFLSNPVPAWWIRAQLSKLIKDIQPEPEIYPKQDTLTGKKVGNLMRYPLHNKSRFLDRDLKPIEMPEVEVLAVPASGIPAAPKTSGANRAGLPTSSSEHHEVGLPPLIAQYVNRAGSLLARRWRGNTDGMADPSRSALAVSICCELVKHPIPTSEVERALEYWCQEHDYQKGRRPEWIRHTVEKAYKLVNDRPSQKVSVSTVKDAALKYLNAGERITYPSGIKEIDRRIEGAHPGEMVILAARPSHCKSAFAMQWVDYTAWTGHPCLFCSAEMSDWEVGRRTVLSVAQDTPKSDAVDAIMKHYSKRAPVYLEDECPTVEHVCRFVDQHTRVNGIKLAVVDYAQLLRVAEKNNNSRYEVVTEISQRLKATAKHNDVAMLLCVQMNRDAEIRMTKDGKGWDPVGSDLKESGQLEQDADKIIFLARPWQFDPNKSEEDFYFKLEKNRNGGVKYGKYIHTVKFDSNLQRFYELTQQG